MRIRKWATNNHELLKTILEDDRYHFEPLNGEDSDELNVTLFDDQETTSCIAKDTKY